MTVLHLDLLDSTDPAPEVMRGMESHRLLSTGAPSSSHTGGAQARKALAEARKSFQGMLNAADPEEVIFTGSGTESANLVLKGLAWKASAQGRKHLVLSAIEHPAVTESLRFLEGHGFECSRIGVDAQGRVNPQEMLDAIRPDTFLMVIHQGHYDVGTLQDVEVLGQGCAAAGVSIFCDASSLGGWMPLDVRVMKVDLLSLSPHRFFGPTGVGVLYRRKGCLLESLIHGGPQEFGLRAGMENTEAIVGAGIAAELSQVGASRREENCRAKQRRFLDRLRTALVDWQLNGPEPGPWRDPHHLSLSFDGIEGEALALRLDLRGIRVSAGTGCRSRELRLSPALLAMGVPKERALGTIRIGLNETMTDADTDRAVEELALAVNKLRGMNVR